MMVLPTKVTDSVEKSAVVIGSLRTVEDPELLPMFILQKLHNFIDAIPIGGFYHATGREGHGNDSGSDVGDVQVILAILEPSSFPAD